jgi:uncharacterized protein YjiS (DUF1127 family)
MHNSTTATPGASQITAQAMTDRLAMVVDTVSRCIAWIRYRRQIRRDVEALKALDDYLLADIGLRRSQIRDTARIGRLPGYHVGGAAHDPQSDRIDRTEDGPSSDSGERRHLAEIIR